MIFFYNWEKKATYLISFSLETLTFYKIFIKDFSILVLKYSRFHNHLTLFCIFHRMQRYIKKERKFIPRNTKLVLNLQEEAHLIKLQTERNIISEIFRTKKGKLPIKWIQVLVIINFKRIITAAKFYGKQLMLLYFLLGNYWRDFNIYIYYFN